MDKVNPCSLCGAKVNVKEGGAVLTMTFCIRHTVNLSNMSYCKECYETLVEKPLKKLNEKAALTLSFEEIEDETSTL